MSKNKRLQGVIAKASNGHLSYEVRKAKFSFLPLFLNILSKEFLACSPKNEVMFVSSISGYVVLRGIELSYGCDDISGVYLSSLNEAGDELIKAFIPELNAQLKKVNFSEHIRM